MTMSPGKLWGMRRLADANGHLQMVAIDQRTPIFGPIAAARGTTEPTREDIVAVKQLLARHLAPHSSAILMDPNFAYPLSIGEVPPHVGLILSYEHHVTENTPGGRKSVPIPDWSVAKTRRIGADAVKVLVWYRADAAPEVRAHQEAFVEAAGRACQEHDIVMLLEVLIYPLPGEEAGTIEARREELVLESVRPFCDPRYAVDIFKLEPPGAIHNVPDPDSRDGSALQAAYDRMAATLPQSWVMLSAGAGPADFERSLHYAYRAGASGYLAGRAIWWEPFQHFPDLRRMESALASESVGVVERLDALTAARAVPWHANGGAAPSAAHDEPSFPAAYGTV
jgi:tagatose 1,6-diphosphate aldolase